VVLDIAETAMWYWLKPHLIMHLRSGLQHISLGCQNCYETSIKVIIDYDSEKYIKVHNPIELKLRVLAI
jgi:hypothetical protein